MISANRESGKWRISGWLLFIALLAQLYFLFAGFPFLHERSAAPSRLAPIAELVTRRNTVRTQNPGELVWDDTPAGTTLYRRQSIQTMESSQAEIAFLDGTGLVLGENSLVQLEKVPSDDAGKYQRIVVRLLHGTLQKRAPRRTSELLRQFGEGGRTPEFEIDVGNSRAILSPDSELTVRATPESGGSIRVQQGQLSLVSGSTRVEVSAGDELRVARAGSNAIPTSRRSAFTLLAPRGGDEVSPERELVFSWKMEPAQIGDSPVELQLSKDPEFKTDVRSKTIPAASPPLESVRADFRLDPAKDLGTWYWRVHATTRDRTSPVESFVVRLDPRPAPELPTDGAIVTPKNELNFVWKGVRDAEEYELEIDQASGKRYSSKRSLDRVYRFGNLPEGEYIWRVRARVHAHWSPWSAPAHLRSAPKSSTLPPPAELHKPVIEVPHRKPLKSSWLEWLLPSAYADESIPGAKIRLEWDPVEGTRGYRLQISRRSSFRDPMVDVKNDETFWIWDFHPGMENTKGRVFYRVAAVGPDGRTGPFSNPEPIVIPKSLRFGAKPSKPEPTLAVQPQNSITKSEIRMESPKTPAIWSASVMEGLQNLSQSGSATDLQTVETGSPFTTQSLRLAVEYPSWWAKLQLTGASFGPESGSRIAQPRIRAIALSADAFRPAGIAGAWHLGLGAHLGRAYHWVKTGPQSVGIRSTLAVGPAATLVRNYGENRGAMGMLLELPMTGILTGGQAGASLTGWREWNLFGIFTDDSLLVRLSADARYLHWSKPAGTGLFAWSVWAGPVLRLSSR